jgi:hypothetical protein
MEMFNGGDPTGLVKKIHWTTWGGASAVGHGLSWWVPPTEAVAQGYFVRATVVAFKLGKCDGHWVYRDFEWYVPAKGQAFSTTNYETWCDQLAARHGRQIITMTPRFRIKSIG